MGITTRPETVDDLFDSEEPTRNADKTPPVDGAAPGPALGALLDEPDEKKVAETLVQWLKAQAKARKRRRVTAERNRLWAKGFRGVRVRAIGRGEDITDWELHIPLGALDLPPVMDRVDELLERVTAHLLVDPPQPDAEPATDSDTDRDGAEFTTRVLTAEGSESGFNLTALLRRAVRKGGVFGSAFLYPCVDPTGNGHKPMEIQAHPNAPHKDVATLDPETGMDVAGGDGLVTRYVKADGGLTDDPNEAERQWLPKINADQVLTCNHVAFLPETATGIGNATGVLILLPVLLSDLKAKFPAVAEMSDEDLRKLVDWRPDQAKAAAPAHSAIATESRTAKGRDDRVTDDSVAYTLTLYFKAHSAYQKGAYIVTGGGEFVLHRQPHCAMIEIDGKLVEECLEIPLAQIRQLDDDIDDDPMGGGLVAKVGPADEVRGTIVVAWLEYIDKFLHPNTFLPVGSIVQPEGLEVRDGTPIYFNPQGKPEQETISPFPPDGKEFFDRASDSQDAAVGLGETAQGLESPNSVSGVAKRAVIQQAQVNLATMRQNLAEGTERFWRIVTQLIRAYYTVPQKLKYLGDDGSYKLREWSRIDLGSTKDIKIARGTFTQMSPERKQQMADVQLQMQVIDPEEYQRIVSTGVGPVLGVKDNPHRQRVRRQLEQWKAGPPPDWQGPPQPPVDALGQPVLDPLTMQPVPAPVDPADPFASDARLVDEEQDVARVRYLEIRRFMGTSAYAKHPPQWRASLDQAYLTARQAAGVQTIGEQQQAMMAQQEAQVAQQQQALAAEQSGQEAQLGDKEAERAFRAEESAAQRETDLAREEMKLQGAARQLT